MDATVEHTNFPKLGRLVNYRDTSKERNARMRVVENGTDPALYLHSYKKKKKEKKNRKRC